MNRSTQKKRDLAEAIEAAVFGELSDRGGFDGWFDGIDEETQEEIRATLRERIEKLLNEGPPL